MDLDSLKKKEPLFGEWYTDNIVARGKSSVVYRVTKKSGDDALALKVIRFPKSDAEFSNALNSGKYSSVADYLDHLESLVRANMDKMMFLRANKNIVRFDNYEVVREEGSVSVIILMELLTPLSAYLTKDKCTCGEVAKLGSDLCCALQSFRSAGVMHRDINPENVYGTISSEISEFILRRKSKAENIPTPHILPPRS